MAESILSVYKVHTTNIFCLNSASYMAQKFSCVYKVCITEIFFEGHKLHSWKNFKYVQSTYS